MVSSDVSRQAASVGRDRVLHHEGAASKAAGDSTSQQEELRWGNPRLAGNRIEIVACSGIMASPEQCFLAGFNLAHR